MRAIKSYFILISYTLTLKAKLLVQVFAKLSPEPQPQLGAEVVIFSIDPTTHTATHPPIHSEKFKFGFKQHDSQKQSFFLIWLS